MVDETGIGFTEYLNANILTEWKDALQFQNSEYSLETAIEELKEMEDSIILSIVSQRLNWYSITNHTVYQKDVPSYFAVMCRSLSGCSFPDSLIPIYFLFLSI